MQLLKVSFIVILIFCSFSQAREWDAHEVSLRASIEKIRGKETKIGELIQQKNKLKNSEDQKPVLDELAKEYKELQKLYEDFEAEKRHVRFEHPEQGLKTERKYHAYRIKSLEEYESEGGVEGRLNEVKLKVLNKYGTSLEEPKKVPEEKSDKNGAISLKDKLDKKLPVKGEKQKIVELPPYKENSGSPKVPKVTRKVPKPAAVKTVDPQMESEKPEEKAPERIKLSF